MWLTWRDEVRIFRVCIDTRGKRASAEPFSPSSETHTVEAFFFFIWAEPRPVQYTPSLMQPKVLDIFGAELASFSFPPPPFRSLANVLRPFGAESRIVQPSPPFQANVVGLFGVDSRVSCFLSLSHAVHREVKVFEGREK